MNDSNVGGAGLRPWLGLAAGALMLLPLLAGQRRRTALRHGARPRAGQCLRGRHGLQGHRVRAAADQGRSADDITARCPDARPFLVTGTQAIMSTSAQQLKRWPRVLTVVAINHADAPGRVTLHIGCAKERPGGRRAAVDAGLAEQGAQGPGR